MNHETQPGSGRNLSDVISEIKAEIRSFFSTRVEMFRAEFQETVQGWKQFVPLTVAALVLFATAYFLFTLAVVALVAVAFWNNPYHWFFAFLIVGFVWTVTGALLANFARNTYKKRAMFPKRSLGVLRDDKAWLQMEARGHL